MALQFDSTTRNSWLTTLNTNLGTSAQIKIYTGSPPASVASAVTGTLLSTLTGNSGGWGTVSAGVLTAQAITQDSDAAATGTAGYFRLNDSGGGAHAQGTVGTSGADLNFNTVSINASDVVQISSWTITAPGS